MNDRNQYWHANIYLQMYSQVSYNYSNSINIIINFYFTAVHFKE